MDTKYTVKILTLLYDRPLKNLIGYKDTAFTVELVEYMFKSFKDVAELKDNFFDKLTKSLITKCFDERTSIYDYTYREGYIEFIHEKFKVPSRKENRTKEGKQDLRKDLSDFFKIKIEEIKKNMEKEKKQFPLEIDFGSIRHLLILALGLRNERTHNTKNGTTKLYKEYEYLRDYYFLLEFLLYAFYHMVFNCSCNSYKPVYLYNTVDTVQLKMKLDDNSFSSVEDLLDKKDFSHMMHVYSDYLFQPLARLLFKSFYNSPYRIGNEEYNSLSEKVEEMKRKKDEKQLSPQDKRWLDEKEPERNNINKVWKQEWCKELIATYSRQLLEGVDPTEKDYYGTKYFNLYSNMLIKQHSDRTVSNLNCGFLDMMKDYLLRVSPSTVGMSQYTPLKKVLQQVRADYKGLEGNKFYIEMEGNKHARSLLDQMEQLAEKRSDHPISRLFLGLMDCLLGLTPYIYMTELQRYVANPHNPDIFISVMKNKDIMKWTVVDDE